MSSSNTQNNKQLRSQLQSLKTEVAQSMNINLSNGDNGNLTSREAGSIGGEMVKRMIAYAQQNMNSNGGNMMK